MQIFCKYRFGQIAMNKRNTRKFVKVSKLDGMLFNVLCVSRICRAIKFIKDGNCLNRNRKNFTLGDYLWRTNDIIYVPIELQNIADDTNKILNFYQKNPTTYSLVCATAYDASEKIKNIVRWFVNRQLFSHMTSVEEVDQLDSGMGSSDAHSPEVKSLLPDDEDDEEDESLAERLLGLTEMFPEEVRNLGYNVGLYAYSCSAAWIFFSSSAILFAPILFEIERVQMEEAQRTQQKQVLLGPSKAMSNMQNDTVPLFQLN
ncbi:Mitochondrial import receptor subunit TOM22 like protein [Melipona quadrifasciata]|uniref:Mitochondrial import receptor subunit TOM22 homolog n=1 Tax=Melipona quadrifasciata TaxID=166423 RepID=A0A0M9A3T3_9HYME|nr:Mitochondrial import receptor subunit TOM22 like protein [Melipona quadrifasciata]